MFSLGITPSSILLLFLTVLRCFSNRKTSVDYMLVYLSKSRVWVVLVNSRTTPGLIFRFSRIVTLTLDVTVPTVGRDG